MSVLARLALKAYPPSFRDRYGAELAALVEDTGASPRTAGNLAAGAVRAWLRPTFTGSDGRGRRLQASMATIWTAWCGGFLVIPAINKALLEPPTRAPAIAVRSLLDIAFVLFFVGWALALSGALPVIIRSVVPAVRARNWVALRPLLPAVLLGFAEAVGLLVIGALRLGSTATASWADRAGVGLWVIGLVVFALALGLGPATSLTRLRPTAVALRLPSAVAVLLALTLTVATGCSLAAVAASGDATLAGSQVPVWTAVSVGGICSVIALTSSVRAMRVLRAG